MEDVVPVETKNEEMETVELDAQEPGSPSVPRKISIHQLVEAERVQSIPSILQKTPALINSRNKEGYTPLHTACLKGLEEGVKILLETGETQSPKIDIEARDKTGWTPLHCASLNGHTSIVDMLIQHKADVNAVTANGSTALHYAASWGRLDCMKSLVEAGCRVDQRSTYSGQTALHVATAKGYTHCVNYILSKGANVIEVDIRGRSSLDIAKLEAHGDIADILIEYKKMVPWYRRWKAFICCQGSGELYSVLPPVSSKPEGPRDDSLLEV